MQRMIWSAVATSLLCLGLAGCEPTKKVPPQPPQPKTLAQALS